jgi:phage terminase Nu1 subunit (DNA packaging protein)
MTLVAKLSARETAAACKVSINTLRDWWARGAPRDGSPDELQAWRDEHIPPRLGGPGSRQATDDDDENLQIQRLKAEIHKLKQDGRGKELKNDVFEGKLVPLDDVLSQVSELVLKVKFRLESVPDEVAPEFSPDVRGKVVELLKEKVFLLLTEMSQWQLEGME